MRTTVPMRRPSATLGAGPSLEKIARGGRKLPPRIIVHAGEKWGKTSFAAMAPKPIFLMTRGEDGLLTLMDSGCLPDDVPYFPDPCETWNEVKMGVNELIVKDHEHKTLVIDTLNGAERLCHEHVCQSEFQGDWGDKGFLAYHKGYDLSLPDWLELLAMLDRLREKGIGIIALCHTRVATFKNPEGADFDRYQPDLHAKTWSATHKWADMILFGMFETYVDDKKGKEKKGKATGGQTRILHTERHAAFDAGNRHNLPPEIELGATPQEAWQNFQEALTHGKE
jgi:hypothetical protein